MLFQAALWLVLSQQVVPVQITDPTNASNRAGVTNGSLKVTCISGCSGGSGGGGGSSSASTGTLDGGNARDQGLGRDGGVDWGVTVDNFPASQAVTAAALPLPTGASTETTLAAVKGKTDNLDVLLSTRTKPADQQHTIIDSSSSIAVTGPLTDTQLRATAVPVSGTVSATVSQATGTNLHTVVDSAPTTAVTGPLTDTQLRATAVPVSGTVTATVATTVATQGSGEDGGRKWNVSADLDRVGGIPIGAFLPIGFDGGFVSVSALDVALSTRTKPSDQQHTIVDSSATIAVTGPVTDTQLRATPVPVSGTVSATVVGATLAAGSALVGKVGLDQTTPGTTNGVALAQLGSTTVDSNSGAKSAGTLRVVLATDQPALTNKLLVTPDSVALPANQSVNTAQFGGTNVSTGTGVGGAGIPRVTVSSDSSVQANAGTNLNTSALALSSAQTDRSQFTKLTDGTRDGTVKAASTAAGATDTALVVALSPNSPLPAGSAVIGHVIADTGSTTAVTGSVAVTGPLTDTQLRATAVPVSGTVTANQGGAPWSENLTQFGGTNLSTGTGTGGAGIPRVTVSSDSTVALSAGSAVIGHVVVDTAPSTTVTQATGSNLHTVVDSAPTTAVTNAGLSNLDVLLSTRTKPADQQHVIVDSSATVATTLASTTITGTVAAPDVVVSGSLTATAQTLTLAPTSGETAWSAQISGTWTGALIFEGTINGTDWVPLPGVLALDPSTSTTTPLVGSITQLVGVFRGNAAGMTTVRVNALSLNQGSATISMHASSGAATVFTVPPLTVAQDATLQQERFILNSVRQLLEEILTEQRLQSSYLQSLHSPGNGP